MWSNQDYRMIRADLTDGLSRKSDNSSVKILDYPARNGVILRNFDFFLPKFHFILPNFYILAPWKIVICSVAISDFLGIKRT